MPESILIPTVPIIGRGYDVKAWAVTLALECQCETRPTLMLTGQFGAIVRCPSCGRGYVLRDAKGIPERNALGAHIEVFTAQELAEFTA